MAALIDIEISCDECDKARVFCYSAGSNQLLCVNCATKKKVFGSQCYSLPEENVKSYLRGLLQKHSQALGPDCVIFL